MGTGFFGAERMDVRERANLRGDDNLGGWVTTEEWIMDAHGVWADIREMDVLDGWNGRAGRLDRARARGGR